MIDAAPDKDTLLLQLQAELAEVRAQLATVQKLGGIAFWTWHVPTGEVGWSDGLWTLLGRRPDGTPPSFARLMESVAPADRAKLSMTVERSVFTLQPFTVDHEVVHPDGSRRFMSSRGQPVLDDDGQVQRIVVTMQDLTERLTMARELHEARLKAEAADRAKSDFLAAMSHEIRTPMTAVLGMADLLAAEELDQRQQGYVAAIRSSGRHLLSVINDILDFSRIEAGRLELEAVDFSIGHVLEDVRSLLAPQAVERGLYLDISLAEHSPPVVHGDPTRLKQILLNLVGNGLKFTHEGGVTVTVRCESVGERLARFRFEVRDTGIGITPERQAALFHAFIQADRSTTRHYGGSGLGLVICKRLVEAMGGTIGLESTIGRGSLFWFELRLELGDAVVAAERASFDLASLPPMRVLVAEDVRLNQDLLREMLGRHGHEVAMADHGADALALAARERFDLVLMDVQMPVMDGIEATRRIRRLPPPAGEVPVVALTANVTEAERRRCLAAGMNRVLLKPIAWAELFMVLSAFARNADAAPAAATAPPPTPAEAPLIDHDRLAAVGEGMAPEILSGFLDEAMAEATRAHQALQASADRSDESRRIAHRLAGTMLSLGLARLGQVARDIEEQAERGGNPAGLVARLGSVLSMTREAVTQLGRAG